MNRTQFGKAPVIERPPTPCGVCVMEMLQTFDRQSVFSFSTRGMHGTCKAKEVDTEAHQD